MTDFHGWRGAWAAFAVAIFGWGVNFYGPPILLQALHAARGWPVPVISAAITCHFLLGAVSVANLARLHQRFGTVATTRAGALATALGFLGWALAVEPWQLFAATLVSGFGWAATGAAAINAIVSPWFARRRPAALSLAYNGASVGGIVLTPAWVALIASLGLPGAVGLVGAAMVITVWALTATTLARSPAAMGQFPDGDTAPPAAIVQAPSLFGTAIWHDTQFTTLALATSLALFAQIGLIAHLFSIMVPALGATMASYVGGLATVCAILGRFALGWLLPPGTDRRRAAAANLVLQACGSCVLLTSGGTSPPLLVFGTVLFGLGLGNVTSLPPLIVQQDFTARDTARAVALVTAVGQAAYAFAPAAFSLGRGGSGQALFIGAARNPAHGRNDLFGRAGCARPAMN